MTVLENLTVCPIMLKGLGRLYDLFYKAGQSAP